MKGYRISLIRHGRTEANDKGIYIGRTDYPLSQKGISELYNKLDEFEYPHVGKVYSSPLQRCTETAEILFPDSSVQIVENLIAHCRCHTRWYHHQFDCRIWIAEN